ncbi:MAG: tetratricopeptide repeat protein [Bacteroidales bacterium]|nr:tetratricopeptide repeat protein [Bacteroidales bacterium]
MKFFYVLLFSLSIVLCANAQSTDEQLAVQYYQNGEFDKAAVLFERLYESNQNTYLYNYYINSLIGAEDYETAETFLKRQMRRQRNNVRFNIDLGYIYKSLGENEKSQKEFETIVRNLTANENVIRETAGAFIVRRELDYAVQCYTQGRTLLRNNSLFGFEMAYIFELRNDYTGMVNEYLNLLEENTNTYLATVQNRLQTTLSNDPEGLKSDALKKELLIRIQRNPSTIFYSEMLLWHAVQQKDFETAFIQSKAIDRRSNGNGERVLNVGITALNNAAYTEAAKCFEYIIEKGENNYYYVDARVSLLQTRYAQIINSYDFTRVNLLSIENQYLDLIREYGKTQRTFPLIKDLAYIQAFYLGKADTAIIILNEVAEMPTIPQHLVADLKLLLGDILLMNGNPWEATLIYSQVEKTFKNAPIGHDAKFRNARLSFYINEFEWAKAQLDILKASTSKLIANDAMALSLLISDNVDYDSSYVPLSIYARADMLSFQNKDGEALDLLDSLERAFPHHLIQDNLLFKKAQIFIKSKQFSQADSVLKKITDVFPSSVLADNSLFLRAEMQEKKFGNIEKAKELYQELMLNYKDSVFMIESRKRFRALRGDGLN